MTFEQMDEMLARSQSLMEDEELSAWYDQRNQEFWEKYPDWLDKMAENIF